MMENTTDRLFWTLTSVIVAALLLTISIKTFPQLTQNVLQPVSGMLKQADTTNSHVNDAVNQVLNQSNDSTSQNTQQQLTPDQQDTQDRANAIEANTLGLLIASDGNGTVAVEGTTNNNPSALRNGKLTIPKYVKDANGNVVTIDRIGNAREYGVSKSYYGAFDSLNNPNSLKINSVDLPNSITSIGGFAFANNQLTSIIIPNSIKSIGNNAFNNNKLKSLNIPNSITNISDYAFENNQLTSVNIPNTITSIGNRAFNNNKLTNINIPNSVTSIGFYAFGSNQLTSVNIPNSKGYQSAQSNTPFNYGITITNNSSK